MARTVGKDDPRPDTASQPRYHKVTFQIEFTGPEDAEYVSRIFSAALASNGLATPVEVKVIHHFHCSQDPTAREVKSRARAASPFALTAGGLAAACAVSFGAPMAAAVGCGLAAFLAVAVAVESSLGRALS